MSMPGWMPLSARHRSTGSPTRQRLPLPLRGGGRTAKLSGWGSATRRHQREGPLPEPASSVRPSPRRGGNITCSPTRTAVAGSGDRVGAQRCQGCGQPRNVARTARIFRGLHAAGRPRRSSFLPTAIPKERVMFVGEAPGRDEDIAGHSFVGRSGKLLDLDDGSYRARSHAGLYRQRCALASARQSHADAAGNCHLLPFIRRQIELADPDILVCLGQPSTQTLLGPKKGSRARAGAGSNSTPAAARYARSQPSTPPSCCVARCRSDLPGGIFWRSESAFGIRVPSHCDPADGRSYQSAIAPGGSRPIRSAEAAAGRVPAARRCAALRERDRESAP